jgi:hypothetical protein
VGGRLYGARKTVYWYCDQAVFSYLEEKSLLVSEAAGWRQLPE